MSVLAADTPLFDMSVPLMFPDDSARTRRTDPVTSHAAGDRSQLTVRDLRVRVLILVRENPFIIGTELNDMYRQTRERRGWPRIAYDSPRKRCGELLADGLLLGQGERDGGRQFIISGLGLDVIA